MKTLKELDDIAFLRQANKIRHTVGDVLEAMDFKSIRNRLPQGLTGAEPEAVRAAAYRAQSRKNLDAMIDRALDEKPEETMKLARCMVVLEDGDPNLTGYDAAMVLLDVLGDQRVLDFFTRLMKSGLLGGGD